MADSPTTNTPAEPAAKPEPTNAFSDERRDLIARLRAGMIVKVHQRVQEGGKERVQIFEGTILGRRGGTEPGASFTVRKLSSGIAVERIYPAFSPVIRKIEITGQTKVRRAKLSYLRNPDRKKKRKDTALVS